MKVLSLSSSLLFLLSLLFQGLTAEHLNTLKMEAVFSPERMYPFTKILVQKATVKNI